MSPSAFRPGSAGNGMLLALELMVDVLARLELRAEFPVGTEDEEALAWMAV